MSKYSNTGQPMRSISERRLPQWEREALDQWRNDDLKNKAMNPAIWDKLMMVEAKMDQILALLQSKS